MKCQLQDTNCEKSIEKRDKKSFFDFIFMLRCMCRFSFADVTCFFLKTRSGKTEMIFIFQEKQLMNLEISCKNQESLLNDKKYQNLRAINARTRSIKETWLIQYKYKNQDLQSDLDLVQLICK